METYGNNDWRDYLAHYGTPRHSGRYPWGSGKNPRQGTARYYGTDNSFDKAFVEASSKNKIKHPGVKVIDNTSNFTKKKVDVSTPLLDVRLTNPFKGEHNCMPCTAAYEMRRRGYDVVAKSDEEITKIVIGSGSGILSKQFNKWFPKAERYGFGPESDEDLNELRTAAASEEGNKWLAEALADTLQEQGVGARGNLMMLFTPEAGHSVAYEVTNKGICLYDGQTGAVANPEDAKKIFGRIIGVEYMRLDNVDFDESIGEAIQNRK